MFDAIGMMLVGVLIMIVSSYSTVLYIRMHWVLNEWTKLNKFMFIIGIIILIIIICFGSIMFLAGHNDYNLIKDL